MEFLHCTVDGRSLAKSPVAPAGAVACSFIVEATVAIALMSMPAVGPATIAGPGPAAGEGTQCHESEDGAGCADKKGIASHKMNVLLNVDVTAPLLIFVFNRTTIVESINRHSRTEIVVFMAHWSVAGKVAIAAVGAETVIAVSPAPGSEKNADQQEYEQDGKQEEMKREEK